MKARFTLAAVALLAVVLAVGLIPSSAAYAATPSPAYGRIVVANRASGSISVISAKSDQVLATYALPGDAMPEPMYVVYSAPMNRVFVGDRGNSQVVVYDARTFEVEGTVPTGAGVWHMWADPQGRQMWVTADVDNTITVFDPKTLDVLANIPAPANLADMGGLLHDVIVSPTGRRAFATVNGVAGDSDYVVRFSTISFEETGRAALGKDLHLSLNRQNPLLYVPSQGNNAVFVLDQRTLELVTTLDVPGAHGAGMTRSGRFFYTTNLPGGGTDALWTIDTRTNTVIGGGVDTPYQAAHNIAVTPNGYKLYVTHSGGDSNKVTVYRTMGSIPLPVYAGEVTVEYNPFGLTFVP
jgi:DNA-binding beta-propeller fold protein YncE